jgi:hypothetical protein
MHSQSFLHTFLTLAATFHLASAASITAPPRPLAPRQTAPPSTFDANVAACSSYSSLQVSCAAATTSFTHLPFSSEATCLCYTDISTFAPSIYDGWWDSCLNYYQTASPSYYSQTLSGDTLTRTPCAAAGNVMGAAAATGVVSSVVAGTGSPISGSGASLTSTTTAATGGAVSLEKRGFVVVAAALPALFAVL